MKKFIKDGLGAFVAGILILCFVGVILVIAIAPRYNKVAEERDDYRLVSQVLLQGKILHYQIYPDSVKITYGFDRRGVD